MEFEIICQRLSFFAWDTLYTHCTTGVSACNNYPKYTPKSASALLKSKQLDLLNEQLDLFYLGRDIFVQRQYVMGGGG